MLETEAQGFPWWTPYDGQLRLQAYSHVASGANMVEYWHWHSIHNSFETYWKGLLSHDFKENDTYRAAKVIGKEFQEIGSHLVNLKKHNRVGLLVSNEALSALNWFPVDGAVGGAGDYKYNDVVRYVYNQLYRLNVGCDFLWPDSENLEDYDLLVVPALYAAPEELLLRIRRFVERGGRLFATFKTAFADENVKVFHDSQPHILDECLGISYSHFTHPKNVRLTGGTFGCPDNEVKVFMELVNPEGAKVLASYDHYNWKRYAAVTRNSFGKGTATYLGCVTSDGMLREILADVLREAGLWTADQEVEFPVIIKRGTNQDGKQIVYYLNYSASEQTVAHRDGGGVELTKKEKVAQGDTLTIGPWDLRIVEWE